MFEARVSLVALAWVCAAVALPAAPVSAQLPDLVDLQAQYMPGVALEDPKPAEAQVSSYDVALNLPLPVTDDFFLIPGVSYHVESVSYANAPEQLDQLQRFQSVDAALLAVKLLPSGWSASLRVSGGLAGDFEAVDSGVFRLNALVLFSHEFSAQFVLGGGALAGYAFGSFLPLPALYMDWRPVALFQLEMFLPAFVKAKLIPVPWLEVGLLGEVAGNAYAIRDERVAGSWPCVAEPDDDPDTSMREDRARPSQCVDHIAYSVITAGLQVSVRVFSSVWLSVFGGHSLYRRFEPRNANDDRIAGQTQDMPDTWAIRGGITWRIPRDQP